MCPDPVGGLSDFLHQCGQDLRCGLGEDDRLGGAGFVAHSSPFSVAVCRWLAAVVLPEVLPGKEDGAQRSKMRS